MLHRDKVIIQKVLSEIDIGMDMMGKENLDDFLTDEKLKRAISMTILNIGELVKNITEETRKEYSQVPWKAIAGMRDITAHKYQTLRMEDVYYTVQKDFPPLKKQLNNLLSS
ncbi:MAG: DUF86 domain-containing protein [Lachnospiraceae bacterium]|nr:DUF86 domain-containing protein [Lachnospiraceae bacterium]